jgi:hypothetical protein
MKNDTELIAASPQRVARLTGLPPRQIYSAIQSGFLVPHKVGKRSVLLVDDVKEWLRAQPVFVACQKRGVQCHDNRE